VISALLAGVRVPLPTLNFTAGKSFIVTVASVTLTLGLNAAETEPARITVRTTAKMKLTVLRSNTHITAKEGKSP
jgi:hypothetical protein